MELPVYDGEERIGTLRVRREGLYTVFAAELPLRPGLRKLWLCGEEESVCLGVLEPRDGALRLEKRLSRAHCEELPSPLVCAALAPRRPSPLPERMPEPPRSERGLQTVRLFGARFVVYRS